VVFCGKGTEVKMDKDAEGLIIKSFDVSGWNLSHEREFVENLFVGRFNYFLLVFSLFVTAGFANNYTSLKSLVFYAGAVLLFMVWLLLYRAYKKHDRILRLIFRNMEKHPAYQIEKLMQLEGYNPKYRVSKLMGVYIPWICTLFLLFSGIMVNIGLLK